MSPALMTVTVAAPSGIVRIFLFCMVVCSFLFMLVRRVGLAWWGLPSKPGGASPAATFYPGHSESCSVVLVEVGVSLWVGKTRVRGASMPVRWWGGITSIHD